MIAYGPLALSLATLILPLGGWWWRQQSGGRSPSERERLVFEDAITTLTHHDPALRPPRRWFVTDEPELNASVYADTLKVTRGLLESGFLEAVLAHELGHLNSSDARLAAALHRMTTPPRTDPLDTRVIAVRHEGALAVMLTKPPGGIYWRAREYHADLYAANLGQAQSLAMFLENNALENDIPVPFMWLTTTATPRPSTASTVSSTSEQREGQANERTGNNPKTAHPQPKLTPPHTGGAVIIELPRLGRTHPATRGATEQGNHQPTKPSRACSTPRPSRRC